MNKIKVGIIGNGFIGPIHIEAIRRLGFVEVVALADTTNAESKAQRLNIPSAYDNYIDMLRNPDIQVVHNCTPNHLHFSINKDIILSGKHVLSEKPLAVSSEQSRELLKMARERGITHGVNYNYRQFPIIKQLATMVRNDELGKVQFVHGSYLQDWLLFDTDYNWRLGTEVGGPSRALADIGSHWCDTVEYVTGKRIVEVFADLSTVIPIRKKPKKNAVTYQVENERNNNDAYEDVCISTEDCASVLLRFDDGTKGVFAVSQVSAGRKNRLSFELNGSKTSTFWNQEEPEKLWIGHRDRANETMLADGSLFTPEARDSIHHPGGHNEGWPDAMKNMMLNFYSFVRDNKDLAKDVPPFATFEDGHRSMCIIDAILQSYNSGKWVKVI